MYNPYVFTMPYQHLTCIDAVEQHRIICTSHDISILIVAFGDHACTCKMDILMRCQKQTHYPLMQGPCFSTNYLIKCLIIMLQTLDNPWPQVKQLMNKIRRKSRKKEHNTSSSSVIGRKRKPTKTQVSPSIGTEQELL